MHSADNPPYITRFAPSPNGPLHLGHAFSAIVAHDLAQASGGTFLLRIEDIDGARSRDRHAETARADLAWLGLTFEEVPAQSQRIDSYRSALDRLVAMDLTYACTCTRTEVRTAQKAQGLSPETYPGTCRNARRSLDEPYAVRLDMAKAAALTGPLDWTDRLSGKHRIVTETLGDPVIWRKEEPASYHLAVTLDDAADGVTLVTRGTDLAASTPYHRILQELLGLSVPIWHHHALLRDIDGTKLAKRKGSPSLADRRLAGEDGRAIAKRLRAGELPSGISLR
ncbi:Glutamyl-Q tRNA(Asp) synthetase [Alteripontixanthobacter maritimus]|uniref:Glutamyl-Q tRNA(Asp) synthetase n=2 Tax=Alteripontixanthobacter maritimus TaxID=2161824 RepID=A0A369QCL3_9SPHN|nr:Glutamyl-Q tRNA(Asp) synthetase [Alteripontixanthobacter maritimus]